ncbi:MAG TPA: hypothetical protein VMP11_03705 [Verrucomicrobiae bacterium]|nr:hypothetical protein [Verrucomicrobiae bacterium]
MSKQQPTLFPPTPNWGTVSESSKTKADPDSRRTYISNLLVTESLQHLPAAVEHPSTDAFKAYLREHLHFNSANTRFRYAEYIAQRYSYEGNVNLALARFLKLCPDDRARREVLWFETIRATPLLKELCAAWLAKIPESGATREEMIAFLQPRVGNRKPDKIAKEAILGLKKYGHMKSPKPGHYLAVWADPPIDALAYALSQLYPTATAVRMEVFKTDPLWQALLWPAAGLEKLIVQAERTGEIGRVTHLDNYYQFVLQGTGEERLERLLRKWSKGAISK